MIAWIFLVFVVVPLNFISDCVNLDIFFLSLREFGYRFVYPVEFLKEQTLVSLTFLYCYLCFYLMILALCLIISYIFYSSVCFHFFFCSRVFRCARKLLVWDIISILFILCGHLVLRTSFIVSYKFWYVMYLFSLKSRKSLISFLLFSLWTLGVF